MSLTLTLAASGATAARAAAADMLTILTGKLPQEVSLDASAELRRDLALGVAIAGVVPAVPGTTLAALDIADRLRKRRDLVPRIEALKRVLEVTGAEATTRIETTVIGLTDLPTDRILDRLLPSESGISRPNPCI